LVIATSGTAAALAEATVALQARLLAGPKIAAKAGAKTMPRKFVRVKPQEASTADVRKLADRLAKMTNAEREAVPGIGPKRSEIIIAGAQVYARLLERFCLKGFRYSELGLRDGMLAQMLGEVDLRTAVHRQIEDERWCGVLEVCHRYGIQEKQAQAVRAHAAELFEGLAEVHELPAEYRGWLEAAAMMQEVGKFISHQGHHRHAHYIIANSEIFGLSPEQRAIVAAIARYLGKSRPDPDDPGDRPMRMVPAAEHGHVVRAIVLLRLAVALNQDRASAVVGLETTVLPRRVTIAIKPGRGGAELESWAIRKEADYFREVFRRELAVEVL
jgi:exopolyphosphatase/guanosine-5'-triphosphate,3'-diphosphate pyrophosphatase